MEPRARAGKNVGKMNFGYGELRQLLYGSGDAREPLPETMRLLDEIATDFIQSLSFEAARIGHYAGRQKIKYDDFEFALRRNPLFLGKVREMFEMSKEVKDARKMPGIGEGNLAKADVNELAKLGEGAGGEAGQQENEGAAGNNNDDVSYVTGASKKRAGKGEGGKKKKAKTAKAAAAAAAAAGAAEAETAEAGSPSGMDGLFGDDDDLDGSGAGGGSARDGGQGLDGAGGDAADTAGRRGSTAPKAAEADDGDDLDELDDELEAEMR